MPELIERDALKNHLYQAQAEAFKRSEWYVAGAIQSFIDILDKQPTIEPEVRHGRWVSEKVRKPNWKGVEHDYFHPNSCSVCHTGFAVRTNFCPNCGARMDGGADNG